ncbi:antiviral reverse transcriptase Drt3b, partial [Pedobacter sp.]|uniref:antiviral reverse transcriptase Drt3b n=1 Tax=Pedobacter sp. TaxID=1411316 RepID=UPI003C51A379
DKKLRRTSFNYKISHKENDHRELSIPHPKTQAELVGFYEDYKELIIYYCSLSPFSIRKPHSIANYIFFNDRLHIKNRGDKYDNVEESGKEYESLKTFFTYRKYPNIHRFYEDYRYHRAEKKYNSMFKFDISKCFDSIYTHSVAWAIYGKTIVKERLKGADITFPGRFDSFMQNANFGETNGILIGPEFSRVFSEIILQSIDKEIESSLREEKALVFKRDYEIYRYVDDYFIFYNDNDTRDEILSQYKVVLKIFKMSVSDVKNKEYSKPLITELTIAKDKILELFDSELCFSIKKKEKTEFADLDFRCNAKNLITKFKIIISESGVAYKDIMNFTLAVLNKRIDKAVEKFDDYYSHLTRYEYKNTHDPDVFTVDDVTRKFKHENSFTNFLIEMLDFTFFIYAVDPRVNFTIKLCRILSRLIMIYTEKIKFFTGAFRNMRLRTGPIYTEPQSKFLLENRDRMFKKISDEIRLILEKNKVKKYAQIESLYLLIAVQQLGKDFSLSPALLIKYFGFKRLETGELNFDFMPNYFVITVLLFYIRDAKAYIEITDLIKSCILEKLKNVEGEKGMDTEITLLLFDILVCPYLGAKFKRKMLAEFGITKALEQDHLINFKKRQKYWFTKWDKFNFLDEIEAKIAHEPY